MYSQPLGNHMLRMNLLVKSDLTFQGQSRADQQKKCLGRLLLVRNVQQIFRKSYALNLLVVSDLTLDCSHKVKLGWVHIRHHIFLFIGSRGF